jgi:hypothetical protein
MQLTSKQYAINYWDISDINFYFYSLTKEGVQFEAECDVDEVEIVYDWLDNNAFTNDYMFVSMN